MVRRSAGRWVGALVLAPLVVACSGGNADDTSTPSTSAALLTSTSSSTPAASSTSAAATTTTVPAPVVAPAGVQYSGPTALPPEASSLGAGAMRDGVLYMPAISLQRADNTLTPGIVTLSADGTSQFVVIDDTSDFVPPPGFGSVRGFTVNTVASGPSGLVAVGVTSTLGNETSQSLIWFSPDGVSWQRIDPRDVVGNIPLQLVDVKATPDGFLATGAIADGFDLNVDRTDIAVLASPDGVTWRALPRITSTWSVDPYSVGMVGDKVVVLGYEYACTSDSGHLATFSTGAQFRAWHSADDGATWSTVTGPATGLIVEPEPAPTDPALCPSREDTTAFFDETEKRFSARPAAAEITEQGVVVAEVGGERVAVSSDLATWTTATAEHRLATPRNADSSPDSSRDMAIFDQGDELVMLSIEPLRDEENKQALSTDGLQIYSWRSADAGTSWTQQPLGRPLILQQIAAYKLQQMGDAIVLLDIGGQASVGPNFAYISTPGELVDYRICAPAPGAQCSFSESFSPSVAPGADLTGIDLRGATLGEDVDLSNTVMNGALMDGARVAGKIAGADLTGASLTDTDLSDTDLSGTTLTGAILDDTDVNATLFAVKGLPSAITHVSIGIRAGETLSGLDLSGFDLTGTRFTSFADGQAPMTGARFTGATLTDASFFRVDLTGADFTGAVFAVEGTSEARFTETTCPDSLPSDDTLTGRAACRL